MGGGGLARSVIVAKAISRNTRAPAVFIIIARTSGGDGGGGTRTGGAYAARYPPREG